MSPWTRKRKPIFKVPGEIGLDPVQFQEDLGSSAVQQAFGEEMIQVRSLGVSGFPTVIWHQQDRLSGEADTRPRTDD